MKGIFYSFETVSLLLFVTQIFVRSIATPLGFAPTPNVPVFAPVPARSLVTVLSPEFATQVLAPS